MKAAIAERYGPPEALQIVEREPPPATGNRVLVRVWASSVNPIDWKIRRGWLRPLTGLRAPLGLGFDFSGEVVAAGDRVRSFKRGDEVYGLMPQLRQGSYAEYVALDVRHVAPKPVNLTHEQAATVPLAGLTALQALRDKGVLQAGQRVLINGASGGVGTFAVQIAKLLGAEVTGVCSSAHLALVSSLGADATIDHTQQDFTQAVARHDLIFDAVGTRSFAACAPSLAPRGTYVTTRPGPALLGRTALTRLSLGKKARFVIVRANSADLRYLSSPLEAAKIQPVLDSVYTLSELQAAHARSESGHASGKIALTLADAE